MLPLKAIRFIIKNFTFSTYFLFLITIATLFLSCKKQETTEYDTESQSVLDNALAEQEFMSIIPGVIQGLLSIEDNTNLTGACDSIFYLNGDTTDYNPNPSYILYLSGTDCSVFYQDKKIRSGQINIRTNGKINNSGTQVVLKLSNYKADDLSYECDSLLILIQSTSASQINMKVELINGKCVGSNFSIRYKAFKNMSLSKLDPSNPNFSYFYLDGDSYGTNRLADDFQTLSDSIEPVLVYLNCRYFIKGSEEITNVGKSPLKVNYGNGACDDIATYNIFENTVEFKLK